MWSIVTKAIREQLNVTMVQSYAMFVWSSVTKKNKRTTKCNNDIVICNVDIAQCEVRS